MRILVATPLYPPDIAAPAPYVKELAIRLTPGYEVSILTFGHLVEEVPGVAITPINRRRPRVKRLLAFTRALMRAARSVDVVIVENGPSTELAAFFASFRVKTPIVIHTGDPVARSAVRTNPLRRILISLTRLTAQAVITDTPHERPEILPFKPEPAAAFAAYESSWHAHLALLKETVKFL